MRILNLPNTITILRIVAIPVFVTNLVYKNYLSALFIFILAAITDALDGLIARITGQQTVLGKILDPLADKFLLITSFVLFTIYGWIPPWLTICIISRELIVVIGWFLIYTFYHVSISPSVSGKVAIAVQLLLVAYILVKINIQVILPEPSLLIWASAFLAVASGFHYVYKGLTLIGE